MTTWYSPQLSRQVVRWLYFKAKGERIPMTVLANRIMENAIDTERVIECQLKRDTDNGKGALGEHAGRAKSPAISSH
jgi:hypothetical protein